MGFVRVLSWGFGFRFCWGLGLNGCNKSYYEGYYEG